MKFKITILLIILLTTTGCVGNTGRDSPESECYGNCIDASNCDWTQYEDDPFFEDVTGFDNCQKECFQVCYNKELIKGE